MTSTLPRLLLAVAAICIHGAVVVPGQSAEPSSPSGEQLIDQLGHDEFTAREKAAAALTKMGLAAEAALAEGLKHSDLEVRLRCQRLLALVRTDDFLRQLNAFAAGEEVDDERLPYWKEFRTLLGDDDISRSLFVDILRRERRLLHSAASHGDCGALITSRCMEIQNETAEFRDAAPATSVAALLFLCVDEEVTISDQAASLLYRFCTQTEFKGAVSGRYKNKLRDLLGKWVLRGSGAWSGFHSINLSLRYDLEECLAVAEKVLKQDRSISYVRQYAMLAVARYGGVEHASLIEPMLNDETVCSTRIVNRDGTQRTYTTQIRDVAVATLLHLHQQDLKDFGFDNPQPSPLYVYNVGTLGFETDEEREKVQAKWEAFEAGQRR